MLTPYNRSEGRLIISLDFELRWGVCDHRTTRQASDLMLATRRVVPDILNKFEQHQIHATWATVGLLMCDCRAHAIELLPTLPRYPELGLDLQDEVLASDETATARQCHYARELVEQIAASQNQEIATHTFSHFYCLEPGQDIEAFRQDLGAAVTVANQLGIDLQSIVFPRNQYSPEHLRAAADCGFTSYRGTQPGSVYDTRPTREHSSIDRARRLLDSYFGTERLSKNITPPPSDDQAILNIPASRFLRPASKREGPLGRRRLSNIKREMTRAAEERQAYHLWWHPHNFAREPELNLQILDEILLHFEDLHTRLGMQSLCMREEAERRSNGVVAE